MKKCKLSPRSQALAWECIQGRSASRDAERRNRHSQTEFGNEGKLGFTAIFWLGMRIQVLFRGLSFLKKDLNFELPNLTGLVFESRLKFFLKEKTLAST